MLHGLHAYVRLLSFLLIFRVTHRAFVFFHFVSRHCHFACILPLCLKALSFCLKHKFIVSVAAMLDAPSPKEGKAQQVDGPAHGAHCT